MKTCYKILCLPLLFVILIGIRPGFAQTPLPKGIEKIVIPADGYGYFSMDKTGEQLKTEAIADAKDVL